MNRLPFNDLPQKLGCNLYLKNIVDYTSLRATMCKSLHGSLPWSDHIVNNYRTEIYLTIVHISIFDEFIVTYLRVTFNLWPQSCCVCTGSGDGCPVIIQSFIQDPLHLLGFYEHISLFVGGEIILHVDKYVVFVGCAHIYCWF